MVLWGFVELFRVFNNKKRWLSETECAHVETVRQVLLHSYHHLNLVASMNNESWFAMKPKFHAIDELCRFVVKSRLNAGSFWAFGSEDLCGTVAKIAAATHPSSMSLRAAQRWFVSFFSEVRT